MLDDLLAPTFQHHSPAPGQPPTAHGIVPWWTQVRRQFPGLQVVINDLLAEGDGVVVRGTFCFHGPLGRFIEIVRVQDGQITELWTIVTFDRGWRT